MAKLDLWGGAMEPSQIFRIKVQTKVVDARISGAFADKAPHIAPPQETSLEDFIGEPKMPVRKLCLKLTRRGKLGFVVAEVNLSWVSEIEIYLDFFSEVRPTARYLAHEAAFRERISTLGLLLA